MMRLVIDIYDGEDAQGSSHAAGASGPRPGGQRHYQRQGGKAVIAFEIPYPATKRGKAAWNKRFGLNAYYAGKHWSQRKKDAEELHELAHWAMRKAGITKPLVNHPVKVTFFWNDNLDIDNHGALGKALVDAMKGYILPDDNPEWFRAVEHKFWGGDTIRVEIEEAE